MTPVKISVGRDADEAAHGFGICNEPALYGLPNDCSKARTDCMRPAGKRLMIGTRHMPFATQCSQELRYESNAELALYGAAGSAGVDIIYALTFPRLLNNRMW
jgi:hypothetical protein